MSYSTPPSDDDDALAGLGQLPLAAVLQAHPNLADALRPYDGVYTASLIAGLLTVPALQSNCVRLEASAHELLLLGTRGNVRFADHTLKSWVKHRRTIHSQKPEEVRLVIERVSPAP